MSCVTICVHSWCDVLGSQYKPTDDSVGQNDWRSTIESNRIDSVGRSEVLSGDIAEEISDSVGRFSAGARRGRTGVLV